MEKWSLAWEQGTWVLRRILHDPIYPSVSLELTHMPAAKEATSYTGVNVQSDRWTGSILRSSLYDLIDWHWFLRRYLVVFKVSFRDEVVTPGVTATSVLTSAECQCHTSSVWPWSGAPKVCLYDTFLGGLCHLPPWMKNQHGLNEEKNHICKKRISHVWVLVMWHMWLVWVLTTLSVRVCESGEKLCLLRLLNGYLLSWSSSNGFTLRIFILSILFSRWTVIVPFVWTDVMSQGFLCHLDSALQRIPSFLSSTFWPTL